eukprot:gene7883-12352_t
MTEVIVIDNDEPKTFYISDETKIKLRKIWKKSMMIQEEIAGTFSTQKNEKNFELILEEAQCEGRKEDGYTVCGFDPTMDCEYTFHTHCVEVDKNGWPQNYPNLISNEDMIGIVQDSYLNDGYLSNDNGKNHFDVLCCPIGILIYFSKPKIIQRWKECEEKITKNNYIEYMKWFKPRYKKPKNSSVEEEIEILKELIQTTKSKKNQFWATEENALMNSDFNQYIGSWYYDQHGIGIFPNEIKKKFSCLGYSKWFKVKPKDEVSDTSTPKDRANSTWEDQFRWFSSDEFLKKSFKSELSSYIKCLDKYGFGVKFFHWNDDIQFSIDE